METINNIIYLLCETGEISNGGQTYRTGWYIRHNNTRAVVDPYSLYSCGDGNWDNAIYEISKRKIKNNIVNYILESIGAEYIYELWQ